MRTKILVGIGILLLVIAAIFVGINIGRQGSQKTEIPATAEPLYNPTDVKMPITLFFADEQGLLKGEQREIFQSQERVNQIKQAIAELIKGTTDTSIFPVIPQ